MKISAAARFKGIFPVGQAIGGFRTREQRYISRGGRARWLQSPS